MESPGFYPMSGGVNWHSHPHMLSDEFAVYLQDVNLDHPGFLMRRGPFNKAGGTPTFAGEIGIGIISCLDKYTRSVERVAIISVIASATNQRQLRISFLNDARTSVVASRLLCNAPFVDSLDDPVLIDAKPILGGGVYVGIRSYVSGGMNEITFIWNGSPGIPGTSTSITASRNNKVVSGSGTTFTTTHAVGQYLFANSDATHQGKLLGTIAKINSNTELELEHSSLYTITGQEGRSDAIRKPFRKITRGTISTKTNSTTVVGSRTNFKHEKVGTIYELFRASDMNYIGAVSTVQSNTTLTLTANAAFALNNEHYYILDSDTRSAYDFPSVPTPQDNLIMNRVGYLSTFHGGRQWFANHGMIEGDKDHQVRVWFSDIFDAESWSLNEHSGDHLNVTSVDGRGSSAAIIAIVSTEFGLAVLKEEELFIIRGDVPENFVLEKVANIGTLGNGSIQTYGDGFIFMSHKGIHFFNGQELIDLHENLGHRFEMTTRTFKPTTHKIHSALVHDHYVVNVRGGWTPPIGVIKFPAGVETFPSTITLTLNLETNAIAFYHNVHLAKGVTLGKEAAHHNWSLAADNQSGANVTTRIVDLNVLFTGMGVDEFICRGNTLVGPDLYIETKKWDFQDAHILKLLRSFGFHGKVTGENLLIALNTDFQRSSGWTQLSTTFPPNASYQAKEVRVEQIGNLFGFIIHQNSTSLTEAMIGPFFFNIRPLRPGRLVV